MVLIAPIIRQVRLEVSTADTHHGPRLPERLSQLFTAELAQVLAEELAGYGTAGAALHLPQLTLELPPVAMERLEQDLPARLRAALHQALTRLPEPGPIATTKTDSLLAAIRHFLLQGHLPWQVRTDGFDLNQALSQAMQQQPGALRDQLGELGELAGPRQRLARQLARPTLQQLLTFLEPVHAPVVRAYLAETLAAHRRRPLVPVGETELRQVLYELVLADLLKLHQTHFNRRAFVERQLRQLAAHYSLSFEALLHQLVLALPAALARPPAAATLPSILQVLYQQVAKSATGPVAPAATQSDIFPPADMPAARYRAALLYYLRHGSLSPAWHSSLPLTALAASLVEVLRQGRQALWQLAQEGGAAATAQALVRYLPPAARQQLLQVLAPGRARPLLALLDKLTQLAAPHAAEAYRQQLWHHALTYLLTAGSIPSGTATASLNLPAVQHASSLNNPRASRQVGGQQSDIMAGLQQWLTQQASLHASRTTAAASDQLADYLLVGLATQAAANAFPLAQLRRELLARDTAFVLALLSQHWAGQPVLRHLALLADAALLTKLLPPGRAGRRPGARAALSLLLDGLWPTAPGARQYLLREAYLLFKLWGRQRAGTPPLAAARQLTLAYYLPGQALHTYLSRQLQQVPRLRREPFLCWLMAGLTDSLATGVATRRPLPQPAAQLLPASETELAPVPTATEAVYWPAPPAVDLTAATGKARARLVNFQYTVYQHFTKGILADANQRVKLRLPAMLRLLRPKQLTLPAARQYRLAGVATVAEARETLLAYLLHGPNGQPPGLLRAAWHWVVEQQLGAVVALLRQYGAVVGVLPRAAALADAGTLTTLAISATTKQGKPAISAHLAAFKEFAAAVGNGSRVLFFVKVAYLLFHYRPASQFAMAVQQQLAAASLPRQATLARLRQLAAHRPLLAATAFWERLLAALRAKASPTTKNDRSGYPARTYSAGAPPQKELYQRLVPEYAVGYAAEQPTGSASEQPSSLPQPAQDLLFHFLRHGQAPWWHLTTPTSEELSRTLKQAARQQPRPLREFLRQHAAEPTVRYQLAQLADFSLLHQLVPPPGAGHGQQLVRPALAALDRTLRQPTYQPRFRLFLREAYFAFAASGSAAGTNPLAAARQLARAGGLTWHSVLTRAGQLLRKHSALAADPFFLALLQATTAQRKPTPPRQRTASQTAASLPRAAATQLAAVGPAVQTDDWLVLEQYLQTGQPAQGFDPMPALAALLHAADPAQARQLRSYLGSATARARLAALLSPTLFFRLLHWLLPVAYAELAGLVRDWQRLLAQGLVQTGSVSLAPLWAEVLAIGVATGPAGSRPATLASWLLQAERAGRPARETVQHLLRSFKRSKAKLRSLLIALLVAQLPAPPRPRAPAAAPASGSSAPTLLRPKPRQPSPAPTEATYVANAGLVLLWPFFTMLFDRLGYLEQRQFKDAATADRATHVLQFLVMGEGDFPEYLLVLNKLLCGVAAAHPLPRAVPLTPEEKSTGEELLRAVLGRWPALRNTSIAGLRETFLQRPGKLEYHADRVALTVETKTVDILLDQLPWSIAIIKLPWMPLPLYVTWR